MPFDNKTIFTEIARHGPYFELEGERLSPCYFPQYDALWCPVPYIEDGDNSPSLEDSEESKIRYLATFTHECAHRQINYRNIVGFVHLTFTMRKICCLFHSFPMHGDVNRTIKQLLSIDRQARLFFNASHIWDETYSLLYTIEMAKLFGLERVSEQYTTHTLQSYREIQRPYETISIILGCLSLGSPDHAGLLIASIFDTAAAVDAYEVMEWDPTENSVPVDFNVDERFRLMLEFCADQLRREPRLSANKLAARLVEYLKHVGVSVGRQYNIDHYAKEFADISHRHIDGLLFLSMYTTMIRQLLTDMPELLKALSETKGHPLSTVTLRPGLIPDSVVTVLRSRLLLEDEEVNISGMIKVKLNIAASFEDAFMLGFATDCIIWELRNNREALIPNFPLRPEFNKLVDAARLAMKGATPAKKLEEARQKLVRCVSGVQTAWTR